MTWIREIEIGGQNLDAANRVRVSQLTSLGDYKQFNDNQPLFFSEEVIGSANTVYTSAEGGVVMTVNSIGDKVIRQTKQWHTYFSGKSQLFEVTGSDFHPQSGVIKRMGYYSSSTTTPFSANLDGIFVETSDGGEHTFNVYKNGTSVLTVSQSNWNVDKLDGTGQSGLTMSGDDWRRFVVFGADFLYLGGTSVAFGFFANRKFNICHVYNHAMTNNTVQAPMILSPNQPLRWEMESLENGTQGVFNHICGQVSTEGSVNVIGISAGLDTGLTEINANDVGTTYAVLGFRLKSAYRNITVVPNIVTLLAVTPDDFRWTLRLNPSVAGTFTYSDVTNTPVQYAVSSKANPSTNTVSGGFVVASGYGKGNSLVTLPTEPSLRIGSQIDGTLDEFVLCITPFSSNLDIYGTIGLVAYT